jgi:hypothetical protein
LIVREKIFKDISCSSIIRVFYKNSKIREEKDMGNMLRIFNVKLREGEKILWEGAFSYSEIPKNFSAQIITGGETLGALQEHFGKEITAEVKWLGFDIESSIEFTLKDAELSKIIGKEAHKLVFEQT